MKLKTMNGFIAIKWLKPDALRIEYISLQSGVRDRDRHIDRQRKREYAINKEGFI